MTLQKKHDHVFDPAYLVTNEDIRSIVAATGRVRDVLTVTASGDNALFYAAAGATHVDTYDFTMNARFIQNIKTIAIKNIPHDKYHEFLNGIVKIRRNDVESIPSDMRAEMGKYDLNMMQYFGLRRNRVSDKDTANLPTFAEYEQMKSCVTGTFKFIYSDLTELHKKLNRQYDVINISNIFDHGYISDPMEQMRVLLNLSPFLRIGGSIVYNPQSNDGYEFKNVRTQNITTELIEIRDIKTRAARNIVLFRRTR